MVIPSWQEGNMSSPLSPSAQKVQDSLNARGFACRVLEMPASTRTAREAADTIGCTVAQIAKSLLFKTRNSQRPILVIASGPNRVSEKAIGQLVGEPIDRADADFVREQTGFAIGGVPPLGHRQPLVTFLDDDLRQYQELWAAAGSPTAVFRLTPGDLENMTGGRWERIS
jgi:prolyl-tRNA editing enzyme YbaK/EbsC (Cys-tRNA(Pro) deacylase)